MSSQPIAKWKSGHYELALWENKAKEGDYMLKSLSLTKSWKVGDKWERSTIKSIVPNDLVKIQLLLQRGIENLFLKEELDLPITEVEEIEEKPKKQTKEEKAQILAEQFSKGNITFESYQKAMAELK